MKHIALLLVAFSSINATANVSIENLQVNPLMPWGKAEICFTVVGTLPEQTSDYQLTISLSNRVTNVLSCASPLALSGDTVLSLGTHHVVWDLTKDHVVCSELRANFIVGYTYAPLYQVVDLSGGSLASSYPITGLSDVPIGGWSDEYKTTCLVLRRVEAGNFIMGENQDYTERLVTLTKTFYIGVFEVTQRQWELVMGTRPSYFSKNDCYSSRPVEQISFDMIRGVSQGARWPTNSQVDLDSFLGRIREKTGLNFDLPTEAQWKYACRAGTTTDLNTGKDLTNLQEDANMDAVGRYWFNGGSSYSRLCTTGAGTAKVGSYLPNAWGLYDMHGNVHEWCLDWDGVLVYGEDPLGSSFGNSRVQCGGSWDTTADGCTSSSRRIDGPSSIYYAVGFRISLAP